MRKFVFFLKKLTHVLRNFVVVAIKKGRSIPLLYFIILKGLHSHTGEDIIPESWELFRCRSCGLRDFSSPEERSPLSEDAHLHKVKQGCDSMESTRMHYILHK